MRISMHMMEKQAPVACGGASCMHVLRSGSKAVATAAQHGLTGTVLACIARLVHATPTGCVACFWEMGGPLGSSEVLDCEILDGVNNGCHGRRPDVA